MSGCPAVGAVAARAPRGWVGKRHLVAGGMLVASLCVAFPAAAGAAQVTLEYEEPVPGLEPEPAYGLVVRAGAGEQNRIVVERNTLGFSVRDQGAALTAGTGCRGVSAIEVRCATPRVASHFSVFIAAGDGADLINLTALTGGETSEVDAGSGDDSIGGGRATDRLAGGDGFDWIGGGEGADQLDGGTGDDILIGGPGRDQLTYAGRGGDVTVDLRTGVGGARGEVDRIGTIEDVDGGNGDDRIRGDAGGNYLSGGASGADVVDGREGDDVVSGRRAIGGSGRDHVDGASIDCGSGSDNVVRFRFRRRGAYPLDCERVIGNFYIVSAHARLARDRRSASLRLWCPRARCRGTISLHAGSQRLGQTTYRARGTAFGGRGVRLVVPLSRPVSGGALSLRLLDLEPARDSFGVRLL